MTQSRSITCRNCRAWIEGQGGMRRCPNCGEDLVTGPLPDLPAHAGDSEALQGPAFPQEHRSDDDTAPLSEFIAAGAVLAGLVMIVAGAMLSSGIVALVGVVLMFGVTGTFAIVGGSLARSFRHARTFWWIRGRGDSNDT